MELVVTNKELQQIFKTDYLNEIFLWIDFNDLDEISEIYQFLYDSVFKEISDPLLIDFLISSIKDFQLNNLQEVIEYVECVTDVMLYKMDFYEISKLEEHRKQPYFQVTYDSLGQNKEKMKQEFSVQTILIDKMIVLVYLNDFIKDYTHEKYPFVKEFVVKCKQARLQNV